MIVITFDTEAERAAILAAVAEGAPFGAESYVVRGHRGEAIAGGSMAGVVTHTVGNPHGGTGGRGHGPAWLSGNWRGGGGTGTTTVRRSCCDTAPGTGHLTGCEVAADASRRGVPSP